MHIKSITGLVLLACFGVEASSQLQETADGKLAAQDWRGAAADYRSLLAGEGDHAGNWFSLASALHQLEDYDGAQQAYAAALAADYQRKPQLRYRLARVHMSLGQEEEALVQLEEIARSGGPSGKLLESTTEFQPLLKSQRFRAVVKALTPCTEEEYRHFDFWLGEWDVTAAGSAQPTATSRISSQHDGCVVLEEYRVGNAYTGMSINFYDSVKKVWHQTWMANNGSPVYLEGHLNSDGAMELTDKNLTISDLSGSVNRVTWTPNPDGSVRQFWETSSDGGETWVVSFDGLYNPKPGG